MKSQELTLNLLKRNKKSKVSLRVLSDTWLDLQEYWYSNTNKDSYNEFKIKLSELTSVKNAINTCELAVMSIIYGNDDGYEILDHFDIHSKDLESIKRSISKFRNTKKILESEANKENKKEVDRYAYYRKLAASINRELPYQVNSKETSLAEWVGIFNDLKEHKQAENAFYGNQKRSKR